MSLLQRNPNKKLRSPVPGAALVSALGVTALLMNLTGCSAGSPTIDPNVSQCLEAELSSVLTAETSSLEASSMAYSQEDATATERSLIQSACYAAFTHCAQEFLDKHDSSYFAESMATQLIETRPEFCAESEILQKKNRTVYRKDLPKGSVELVTARVRFSVNAKEIQSEFADILQRVETPFIAVYVQDTTMLPDEGKVIRSPGSRRNTVDRALISYLESQGIHAGPAPLRLPELKDSEIAAMLPGKLSEKYFALLQHYGWDAVLIGSAFTTPDTEEYFNDQKRRVYHTRMNLNLVGVYGSRPYMAEMALRGRASGRTDREAAAQLRSNLFSPEILVVPDQPTKLAEQLRSIWKEQFVENHRIDVELIGIQGEQRERLWDFLEQRSILYPDDLLRDTGRGAARISGAAPVVGRYLQYVLNQPAGMIIWGAREQGIQVNATARSIQLIKKRSTANDRK